MCKKFLLISIVGSTLLFAQNVNREDMLKASIVKLINITSKLSQRVTVLENALHIRKYKKVGVKNPSFYMPRINSFIRVLPYAKAKKVGFTRHSKEYKITELACYKNIGFWGKTRLGWVYISNPRYGKLVDDKGNRLPENYQYWCKK